MAALSVMLTPNWSIRSRLRQSEGERRATVIGEVPDHSSSRQRGRPDHRGCGQDPLFLGQTGLCGDIDNLKLVAPGKAGLAQHAQVRLRGLGAIDLT